MILAIETSSGRGSIAWGEAASEGSGGGAVSPIESAEFMTGRGKGGALFRALGQAIRDPGNRRPRRIIVGLGPGSYSGVRLAIATASGLALATGARLIGRPSPEALATDEPAFQVAGDARRGYFYYTVVRNGRCVEGPHLLDLPALRHRIANARGLPLLAERLDLADLPVSGVCLPDARRFLIRENGEAEPEAAGAGTSLEPFYLRPPSITMATEKRMKNEG